MSFGFPAKYRRVINKSEHSDFREKLMNSLDALSFEVKRMNDDKIILKERWSVWSWGEIIKIDFSDEKKSALQAGAFSHYSLLFMEKIKRM